MYRGQERPDFAVEPGPGQISVWDFPRPPAIEAERREVVVKSGETEIARSRGAVRVLETGGPPTYYIPAADVRTELLEPIDKRTWCEWKGEAVYWNLAAAAGGPREVAWSYPEPFAEFASIRDFLSFYPGRLECFVDGARVGAQPGGFYGGWITPEIVGPFKGDPGTEGL